MIELRQLLSSTVFSADKQQCYVRQGVAKAVSVLVCTHTHLGLGVVQCHHSHIWHH